MLQQTILQTSENYETDNEHFGIDRHFEKIKQWMNPDELDNYYQKDNKPRILLSMILDRYRKNGEMIEQLKKEVNTELAEKLSHIYENMQVGYFFYQATLVDLNKIHNRYMKKISR